MSHLPDLIIPKLDEPESKAFPERDGFAACKIN